MQVPEGLLPALRAELQSPERDQRMAAVVAAYMLRFAARPLAADLLAVTDDSDAEIRAWAAQTLAWMGADDTDVVARLTEMLADSTLLKWPEAGVDPGPILVVLDACAGSGRRLREWSANQRRRLP